MFRFVPLALTLAAGTAALGALSQPAQAYIPDDAMVFQAAAHGTCPPGLAKKSPACVPPGLAGKILPYTVGTRIDPRQDDVILLRDPRRYGLDTRATNYRIDDRIVQVDTRTYEIVRLMGAVSDLLN